MLARMLLSKHVARRFSPSTTSLCSPPKNVVRTFTTSHSLLRRHLVFSGLTTNDDKSDTDAFNASPYYFETAYSIFAKRPSRPFPPPFLSTPSHSFSDPLTTHQHVRRPSVEGHVIRGITNGDDAIIIGGQNFLGVNDGVGAWAQKERGHAALWSRLIAHFWAEEIEKLYKDDITLEELDMVGCLQRAYDHTKDVTSEGKGKPEGGILGTTTASSALLHHKSPDEPVVLATNLGDCAVCIIRPKDGHGDVLYKTKEQWHWFDCPRQLGTNSPDTPQTNAVCDIVDVQEGDVVVVVSDGLTDNLFENEIVQKVGEYMKAWQDGEHEASDGVLHVARGLMEAAKEVALDPNGESPYMERALDEGLAISEGGKLDDISVVIGVCRKR